MSYFQKIYIPKETKEINIKVFSLTTKKKMKRKQWQNIFHVNVNANAIVQHVIQIKNE